MAFRRRSISDSQDKLQSRITALSDVVPDFDLNDGLELAALTVFTDSVQQKRDEYNNTLALADRLRDELDELERKADDISERLYAAVVARYGRDSEEYQQVGGTRKSKIAYTGSRPETFEGEAAVPANPQPNGRTGT